MKCKQKETSDWLTTISAIAAALSFVISLVALCYSVRSVNIAELVEEPIFVQTSTLPAIEMRGDPYAPLDTVGVRFFNYGGVPWHIKAVSAHRVWSFSNAVKPENDFSFFVSDFYSCGSKLTVRGYKGVVAEAFNVNNNKFEFEFHNEFYKLADMRSIGFKSCTVCKIEYENKLHEAGAVYFKDGKPIESLEYESCFKNLPNDFRYGVSMCEIKASDVVARLDGKVEI